MIIGYGVLTCFHPSSNDQHKKRNRSKHFELLMKSSETLNHLSLLQLSNLLPLSLLLLHFVFICPSLCSASLISRFNLWSFPLLTSLCPFYRFAIGKIFFYAFPQLFFLTDHQFLLFFVPFFMALILSCVVTGIWKGQNSFSLTSSLAQTKLTFIFFNK